MPAPPDLAALLADPARVAELTVEQASAVLPQIAAELIRLAALQTAVGARLVTPARPPLTSPYSADEAAALIGKPKTWVWKQARSGRLPGRKAGKTWTFPRDEFDRVLRRRAHIAA
jgi:excisionase family DNA binding protein